MLRSLILFVWLAVATALAIWVAQRPGEVTLEWLGYRIHSSVGMLLAAVIVLVVVAAFALWLWRVLWRSPRQMLRARADRRRREGYRALTQGMVAVAAGDSEEARRQSRRAQQLLREPPLTLLLAAQSAQLNGDEAAARNYFTAMLERPETAFLGLRGLLTQALRVGDETRALELAKEAHRERPETRWAASTLLDLQLRAGDWAAAEATLKDALRLKSIDPAKAKRWRALILVERARIAAEPQTLEAMEQAAGMIGEAVKLAPDLVPARARLAVLTARTGRAKSAMRLIEQVWASTPHPELAAAYARLLPDEHPLARARRFERLCGLAPEDPQSHLAMGEVALAAGLWGEARSHLEKLVATSADSHPDWSSTPSRVCRLMAQLAQVEQGDEAASRRWLMAASEAEPDPAWTCNVCGTPAPAWSARCGHCRAFDSLAWRTSPRVAQPFLLVGEVPVAPQPSRALVPAAEAPAPAAASVPAAAPTPPAQPAPAPRPAPEEGGAPVDAARLVN